MVPEDSLSCLQERLTVPRCEPDNASLNLQMLFRFDSVVQRANFKWPVSVLEPKELLCFSSVP